MSSDLGKQEKLSPVKQAIVELRAMRTKLQALERAQNEPIAIIGLGLRFPGGAKDPQTLWQLLHNGVDAISEVPKDRWDIDAFYDPNPDTPGKMSSRWGGFLDHIDRFDADFFGISPREAMTNDPQQRLLMTVAWEALENAGHANEQLKGSQTGVFVGIGSCDYSQLQMQVLKPEQIDAYYATGASHSVASGRLSYFLGLQGPSVSLDTACSSSLVALHLACQSIRSGECNMALAGGVNAIIIPEILINFSKAKMMSADGRCKTFDAAADGFVRGEGACVVVLKRLSDAIEDRDHILAVIRGSAINQDGRSNGLTAPNGPSQEAVIRRALLNASVTPADVHYVEAHGTGTSLGDPIEVQALGAVMGEGRKKDHPLLIGSIKTNIGHLETAAGVAGLIKVVLAMQNEEIPPHLHLKKPNPYIPWHDLPVQVATESTPWPMSGQPRIAGVSSFGFSGTNAHVVIQDASNLQELLYSEEQGQPQASNGAFKDGAETLPARPKHILNISAKSETALKQLAERYENHLKNSPSVDLPNLCFTANEGRSHFDYRASFLASSCEEMRQKLRDFRTDKESLGVLNGWAESADPTEVVFLFTGQGGQYIEMGRQLFETQPTFRRALERCDELLSPHLEQRLLSVLYPKSGTSSPLNETNYTQPAIFAVQFALAELWRSWGVEPSVIMGHSVGEIIAATVAGSMSLEDGLMIVTERGRLMHSLKQDGIMASIMAGEKKVAESIAPFAEQVAIAALNGPESTVISGERQALLQITENLESEGVKTKRLQVSNSFHSPLVEPVLDEFEKACARVRFRTPNTALFSSMRLDFVDSQNLMDAEYWRHNLRYTVRFHQAIHALYEQGYRAFLEIGPSPILVSMGPGCIKQTDALWVPSLRKDLDDWDQILESLATLYNNGVKPSWAGFDGDYKRYRIPLPSYPFQESRYWIEGGKQRTVSYERPQSEEPAPESQEVSVTENGEGERPRLLVQQLLNLTENERLEQLIDLVRKHVCKVLRRDETATFGRKQRLMDLGVDSLMAVELRNNLATDLKLANELPATLIFDYPNIESVAKLLETEILPASDEAENGKDLHPEKLMSTGMTESEIEELSDEEVEQMLEQKLKAL